MGKIFDVSMFLLGMFFVLGVALPFMIFLTRFMWTAALMGW